jgi:hypothetical protein
VGLGSSADGSWAERKAAESATRIQVSHPRRLPSESIRKRIDRLVLGHPDWTACCEDRRVRWASCKREVRDRGASPPSRALRGLEPTRFLSAADGGTPLTRYVQPRSPSATSAPRQNGGTDRASWSRRSGSVSPRGSRPLGSVPPLQRRLRYQPLRALRMRETYAGSARRRRVASSIDTQRTSSCSSGQRFSTGPL